MAYQQQYQNYSQPRPQQQQQYYEQRPQQPGRNAAGYNDQYNQQYHDQYQDQYDYDYDYGYDQGQGQGQWDNGYYEQQQGGWDSQQAYQQPPRGGGYANGNGQMRQPQPPRGPQPRDPYAQDAYDERAYQQPQGEPRGRPTAPADGQMQGGMQRGASRGGQDRRPPNIQQGQSGLKPPRPDRSAFAPVSPQALSQDNPFPVFPSQKAKPRPKAGSMDEAMSLMNIGQKEEHSEKQRGPHGPPQGHAQGPPQGRGRGPGGPPPARGNFYGSPDMSRHDSGHAEGSAREQRPPQGYPQRGPPRNMEGGRPPPQRSNFDSPPARSGSNPGMQRSMTMPQNIDQRGYDDRQQWQDFGPAPGRGPNPAAVPPRPSTASGTREDAYARQQQLEQRPPMPPMPAAQRQQYPQQHPQQAFNPQAHQGELDNVYDDYYGDDAQADRKSKASSIDMPDFDAMPDQSMRHRRGLSIENHLSPVSSPQGKQSAQHSYEDEQAYAVPQQNTFQQEVSRSRSQPDLHGQFAQGGHSMQNAPAVPPLPTGSSGRPAPNGLPGGPRGRGPPPRGMTMDSGAPRGPPGQGYGPESQQNFDPRYQQSPMQRGYSDDTTYSEPGPHAMMNGSPMMPGNPIARPGTAGPVPGRMQSDPVRRAGTTQPQSSRSPDALPAHPMPVRAGLMPRGQDLGPSPVSRPPPVRQYNTDPTPTGNAPPPQPSTASSKPHPVTHDELNRLRATIRNNPSDAKSALTLAKKLVEASSVLADENGTADKRTRDKNREKYINEAHKMVKKMVQAGSPDAMFYLADCYGQGRLGLQVDTKEAFTLYQSAAKGGHPASAYRTAVCCEMGHEEGGGTKRDPLKAVQWYRRAAALGDVPALYKMGMILSKGLLGQQKNLGEAINMLKRAADRADSENPHALHELALIYESEDPNQRVIRDEGYAAQLFLQAAELGYKFSQFRLGQAYEYSLLGFPVDARCSLGWYTRAAAQEEHQSELALSGWYLTGSQGILEQSDTEAYLWARKAACAEPPLPKALFAMGYFTEVGIGCPRSLEEAKRWYGRAATYKFPKAQERLEELKRGGAKAQRSRERISRSNQTQQENCIVM